MSQEHKISGQIFCIAFSSTAFHNRMPKSLYHQCTRRNSLQSPIHSSNENRRVGLVHLWRNSTASQSGWNYFLSMDFYQQISSFSITIRRISWDQVRSRTGICAQQEPMDELNSGWVWRGWVGAMAASPGKNERNTQTLLCSSELKEKLNEDTQLRISKIVWCLAWSSAGFLSTPRYSSGGSRGALGVFLKAAELHSWGDLGNPQQWRPQTASQT